MIAVMIANSVVSWYAANLKDSELLISTFWQSDKFAGDDISLGTSNV